MSGTSRTLAAIATVTVAATLFSFSNPSPLAGSPPLQNAPEITEKECAFWLDYDGDGKGDQRVAGEYIPQETSVVGGCDFKLSVPEEATIVVESELRDWEAEVEVKREPGSAEDFNIYPGQPEITGVDGSMRVIVNFVQGDTPRTGRVRVLPDGYEHVVQVPNEFRVLGVTVTIPDGSKDRLEENAQSASNEHISTHRKMAERESELPERVLTLAKEWQEQGYPQVANSIIEEIGDPESGSSGWWKWAAIGTWIAVPVVAVVVIGIYLFVFSGQTPAPRDPDSPF
jgi:hypothetical protein